MSGNSSSNWYSKWFDSPYYHVLYKDRNFEEARHFIDNLIHHLQPPEDSSILDVACGKGRHAIHLNKKGFDVTGIDLSKESINAAKKSENEKLHFYQHDMLYPFRENSFDYVLNLFTSFGYFDEKSQNEKAVKAMSSNLASCGKLVLDFMNVGLVKKNLVSKETKETGGIKFNIKRFIESDQIVKEIRFIDKKKEYFFTEKVRAIDKAEMTGYFEAAGLKVTETFGDYSLSPFDENNSERLILVGESC